MVLLACPRYGKAGAVWDIWRVGPDALALRDFCKRRASEFTCNDKKVVSSEVGDSVFDQSFFLGTEHRKMLLDEETVSSRLTLFSRH